MDSELLAQPGWVGGWSELTINTQKLVAFYHILSSASVNESIYKWSGHKSGTFSTRGWPWWLIVWVPLPSPSLSISMMVRSTTLIFFLFGMIHRTHTWYLSRTPRTYSCKFFLAGVNFYRFNAKNWHFRQILREKVAFFGVNFILQKFCQCKRNDKYQVCSQLLSKNVLITIWLNWISIWKKTQACKLPQLHQNLILSPHKLVAPPNNNYMQ